jgi:putative tricarboxylic transport membrane protein
MSVVIVLAVVGAYAINIRFFDTIVMLCFGAFGLLMRRLDISAPLLVLGIILGPLAYLSLRRGLMAREYSLTSFCPTYLCYSHCHADVCCSRAARR